MARIAVLVSGQGTLLKAILRERIEVALVCADRKCFAIKDVAKKLGIPTKLIEREFDSAFNRERYTSRVVRALKSQKIDLVVLAGYKTILAPEMFQVFPNTVLNIHPSLLPAFPGLYAVRDALAYGVKITGCTVHIATEEPDKGQILEQQPMRVLPNDTVQTLHQRIKDVEAILYPLCIKEYIAALR